MSDEGKGIRAEVEKVEHSWRTPTFIVKATGQLRSDAYLVFDTKEKAELIASRINTDVEKVVRTMIEEDSRKGDLQVLNFRWCLEELLKRLAIDKQEIK